MRLLASSLATVLVAAATFLALTAPAAAGPLVGAVALVGAAWAAIGPLGQALVTIGASIGLNLVAGMLKPDPPRQKAAPGGAKLEVQASGDVPRQWIFGRAAVAGHLVYHNVHGKDEKHLQLVYVLADCECDGLESVWVDGEKKGLFARASEGGAHATYGIGGFRPDADEPDIVVRFFRGTMDQAADTELVAHAQEIGGGNTAKRWTAQHRGRGVCYVSLTLTYDAEVFSGLPEFLWEVRGARLYDARKDSTAGGKGDHRWRDKSTWEWTENPPVCAYNYYRGYWHDDVRIGGMGVPAHDLPTASFITAANICDEEVNGKPRYVCSVITSEETEHRDAIQAFLDAMAGNAYELAGLFAVEAGAAQGVVATLTDGDLVVGAPTSFSSMLPRSETANYVTGTYLEPAKAWSMNGYEPLQVDSWEATDGGERIEMQLDLPSVPNKKQARRIRLIRGEEMRCQGRMTVTVGWKWLALAPGDWITWRKHGINTWRIEGRTLNLADLTITLRLREIKRSVYNGAVDDEPDIVVIPPFKPSLPTTVTGLAVQAGLVQRTNPRQKLPCLIVTWDAIEDRRVTSVPVEVRVIGETVAERFEQTDPSKGRLRITRGILAGQDYEVRATIDTRPGRPTAWTGWVSVVTGLDFVVPEADLARRMYDDAVDIDQLDKTIKGFLRDINYLIDYFADVKRAPDVPGWPPGFGTREGAGSLFPMLNVRDLLDRVGDDALVNLVEKYSSETAAREVAAVAARTLSVKVDELGFAMAQEILLLSATVDGNAAQIVEVLTAQADLVSATASRFAALTAKVNRNAAQILTQQAVVTNLIESTAASLLEIHAQFGPAVAAINEELSTIANDLKAEANKIVTLRADHDGLYAYAHEQITVLVDGQKQSATKISELTASSAKAVYTQTTQPTGTINVGDIWIRPSTSTTPLQTLTWTGTRWVVVDSTWLKVNASVVQQQSVALVSKDEVLAAQLNSVTATANGLVGRVDQISEVDIDRLNGKVAGIEAKWGVNISVSGAPNGLAFMLGVEKVGDTTKRTVAFKTDDFYIWSGVKAQKPFYVRGDGNVYIGGDLIAPGSIYGNMIAANEITSREIKAGSIKTGHIDAKQVTAEKIAVGTLTTDLFKANAVSDFVTTNSAATVTLPRAGGEGRIARSAPVTPVSGGNVLIIFNAKLIYDANAGENQITDVELFLKFRRERVSNGALEEFRTMRVAVPYLGYQGGGGNIAKHGTWVTITALDDAPIAAATRYQVAGAVETTYGSSQRGAMKINFGNIIVMSLKR